MKINLIVLFVSVLIVLSHAQQNIKLTLDKSIKIALENNNSIKLAEEKIAESNAKIKEARTGFLPKITGSANYTKLSREPYMDASNMGSMMEPLLAPFMYLVYKNPSRPDTGLLNSLTSMQGDGDEEDKIIIGDDDIVNMKITAQQPLFTGFKILNGYKAAQFGKKASEVNRKKVERDIILYVKQGYYGVLQAQKYVEISNTSIQQLEQLVTDLGNMVEMGMVGEHELLKAEVQLSNVKLMKTKAEHGVELSKTALCNLLGISLESQITLEGGDIENVTFDMPELSVLTERALSQQPEILELEYNKSALEKIVSINRAKYAPNLVAIGNCNWNTTGTEDNARMENYWDFTLALQMNLFDWGEAWNQRVQSESKVRQFELTIQQVKNSMALAVKNHYLAVNEAFEKTSITKNSIIQAEKSYTVTNDKFQNGLAKNSELLEAQRMLTQERIDHYNSVIDYYSKRADLEYLFD